MTLRADVDAAKAATTAKVAAERANMPALRIFTGALVAYVKATFGASPEVLADFGIHPKARAPLTVEQKAAAAAKRAATRKARRTMGSVQKKGVKGDVVGITVTPITAPQPVVTAPASPAVGTTSPAATGSHAHGQLAEVATTREGGRRAVRARAALPGPLESRVRDS